MASVPAAATSDLGFGKLRIDQNSRLASQPRQGDDRIACAANLLSSSSAATTRLSKGDDIVRRQFDESVRSAVSQRSYLTSCLRIDPRIRSARMGCWDAITSIAIMFTAIVTPYEVAFLPMAQAPLFADRTLRSSDVLFVANRLLDAIFLVDMYVQFNLVYSTGSGREGFRWVVSPKLIALNYLKGWFSIDLSSIAVSAVDLVGLLQSGDGRDSISSLRALRALRALRLLKLIRILRGSRIFARWETTFAVDYTMLDLSKCVCALVAAGHWFACVWVLQTALVNPTILDSWIGDKKYCIAWNSTADGTCPAEMVCHHEGNTVACYPHYSLYAASLYWSVMSITSIGYGGAHLSSSLRRPSLSVSLLPPCL